MNATDESPQQTLSLTCPGTTTAATIARVIGLVKRSVLRRAEAEGWKYLDGANRKRRFFIAHLPSDIRAALALTESEPQAGLSLINNDRLPVLVGSPELTKQQNRIALARADLVRLYINEKEKAKSNGRSKVLAADLFIKGYNTGDLYPRLFSTLGQVSRQSLDRWAKVFRDADFDYVALAPLWGNRKGDRKLTDGEFNVLLSFTLHPNRFRIAEAVRLTKRALEHRNIPSPSTEATLRRALLDFKKAHYDQWVFAREGEKALNDKCLPYLERGINLLDVGDVLVADGHVLNFQLLHPFTGKPCRMTMVAWYDWASCMMVGWEIMPTENVQCVASALRRAILTLGKMPKVAYLDNGKAFKSKVFTSKDIDFEAAGFYGMFARLGMETMFAWPYNAQSKPVERFFETFGEIERLMPTYVGTSIENKPAHILRNERLHKQIHEKKYGGWVPTIQEANRIIADWLTEFSGRPHRGLKGLCPGEIFTAGKGPGVDEVALRHMMMSIDVKSVHRNGIRFLGRNYYDEALYGCRDRVIVRYDFEDVSKVLVYTADEKFLCEAKAVQAVHPVARLLGGPDDLAAVKEGIRQKRALKRRTETVARAWVANAPTLVAIPERTSAETPAEPKTEARPGKVIPMPRGEAERIEAEAKKLTLLKPKEKEPDPVFMNEMDKYEFLHEREFRGGELSVDHLAFLRYFEKTKPYTEIRARIEFLREQWLLADTEADKI